MSKRYTVEELWEMYEKKVEECQLAATIGQMLVQENEALKEQLQQQTLMPFPPAAEELDYRDRSSMQDSNLQNEIQQTLIQQSRQLKLRLEEEYQARITAESELQKQIDENDSLVSKNNQLRKKNEKLDEQRWKLQQKISLLESQIDELSTNVSKQRVELVMKRKELERLSIDYERPPPDTSKQDFYLLSSKMSIDSSEISQCNQSISSFNSIQPIPLDLPVSPIRSRTGFPISPKKSTIAMKVDACVDTSSIQSLSICNECEVLRDLHEANLIEIAELKLMLDKSYEQTEKLQNESLIAVPNYSFGFVEMQSMHDVQAHTQNAKQILQDTKNELLDAQTSINAAISDLVKQFHSTTPTTTPKLQKPNIITPHAPITEKFEFDNSYYSATSANKKYFSTPKLGESPSKTPVNLPLDTPSKTRMSSKNRILKSAVSIPSPLGLINFQNLMKTVPQPTQPQNIGIEALTFTMIGSYFLKFNRFQKNPQLRYCWVNPYSRTLNWSEQPITERMTRKTRSAHIVAMQWKDSPLTQSNVPPTNDNCLVIATNNRLIKLLPVSWEIHDQWIKGITFLLKRTKNQAPSAEQFKVFQEDITDSEGEEVGDGTTPKPAAKIELLTGSDVKNSHRRVHTMISHTNPKQKLATPKTIRDHHRKLTFAPTNDTPKASKMSFEHNLFLANSKPSVPGVQSVISTPRKLSQIFYKSRESIS